MKQLVHLEEEEPGRREVILADAKGGVFTILSELRAGLSRDYDHGYVTLTQVVGKMVQIMTLDRQEVEALVALYTNHATDFAAWLGKQPPGPQAGPGKTPRGRPGKAATDA